MTSVDGKMKNETMRISRTRSNREVVVDCSFTDRDRGHAPCTALSRI